MNKSIAMNTRYSIQYNFFEDYLDNIDFNNKFNQRITKVRNQYKKFLNTENIIEDFFVEIFSWTVLPKDILFEINGVLESYIDNYILIDPCSGNSFHTFLFSIFCNKEVITIDIQPEDDPWIETIECDGLEYIKNNIEDFSDKILFLAWIDYDNLTYNLLKNFKGSVVVSVGNYNEGNSLKYLNELENNYELIYHYKLNMPWNHIENIKIYTKKLIF